jgi:hypothetical protein
MHSSNFLPPSVFLSSTGYFIVSFNYFTGSLPSWVKMPSMFYFDISNNQFTGSLPATLDMFELKHLHMESNRFSGSIPHDYSRLGNNRMFQLYLNDNQLTGTIPSGPWHKALPYRFLTNVDVSNNLLTGRIPDSLCQLSVFEEGETVEFRADCHICTCLRFCEPWCEEEYAKQTGT